ncbi:putative glucan endo-1,3-beta-glucosidase GVI isoform X2 [Cornus florida]|uniref:putative glucan endo-1,3-beta-glucosidase GVI isoform X2 n=1 Tax=Cornus florida TaxID=4283 RepID=UPI00289B2407|nr:putative glucan endo-1,3-beta-glucosidase GVI isoform X2 [Cornus florida]
MGWLFCRIVVFFLLVLQFNIFTEARLVGLNYGLLGNNLPPPSKVVALLKSRNITRIRLFAPNHTVLRALEGSGIEVILGTLNEDLKNISSDVTYALSWITSNVEPYSDTINFRCISAGNEVIPGDLADFVLPAMKNLHTALAASNLINIPVSTSVPTSVLGTSYPPSKGEFAENVNSIMTSITAFLAAKKSPLLVNVYPYFAYISNPNDIPLFYALFNSTEVVVQDGKLGYKNLFDAITDAVYSALEKAGGSLGTPKRPGKSIETYVFAIFNENLKPPGTEQNFGLYYPNMTQVYHLNFSQ